MQPYFMPYLGYFQLVAAVDLFIVYDNIQYTKSGWINRNRMLRDGRDVTFTIPLKAASDYLNVRDRELAASFKREKLLNQIKGAYQGAPQFERVFHVVEAIVRCEEQNLFRFILHSIRGLCDYLSIATEILICSDIADFQELKGEEKVLALCGAVGARTYVNAIGGKELYSAATFQERGIDLKFIRSKPFEYAQFGAAFVPMLSIIDVLMFNPLEQVADCIQTNYELI